MNFKYYLLLSFTLVFLFNIAVTSVFAQEMTASEFEMKDNAYNLFLSKKYEEALPYFSQLLSLYPKNPELNYGYGACLIEVNRDTKKALKYLNYALASIDNPKIYYYIGRANHLNYNFNEAINNFNQFKQKASKKELAESDVDHLIEMCNSGTELVKYVNQLIVLENKQVKKESFFKSYEISDFGGDIILKPIDFKSKIDKKQDQNSVMIYSPDKDVYISSYGDNKKNGKDIYSFKKQPDGTWGKPINLGTTINTSFDEDYPYIHPNGKTLYFCSKGHNSMGGYDIFRSDYDSISKRWSIPVNLDFPTNSPYDDILYVSDKNEDIAYFSSNRETDKEKVSVYKIQVEKNPVERKIQDIEDIIQTARLEISIVADNNQTNNRNTKLVQLDPIKNRKPDNYGFANIDVNTTLSKEEIYNEAEKDVDQLNRKSKLMEQDANYALYYANEKNKLSNQKKQEADKANQSGDIQNAELLNKESNKLAREAVVAYNLADNLLKTSSEVKKDAYNASEFSKYLENQEYLDKTNLVGELNKNREKLDQSQKKYTTVESEQLKRKLQTVERNVDLDASQTEVDKLEGEINEISNEIKILDNSIDVEKDLAIKKKLQNHRSKLVTKHEEKTMLANTARANNQKLKIQTSELTVEVLVVNDLLAKMNSNPDEYIAFSNDAKNINKDNLSKEIFEKEISVDQLVAEVNQKQNTVTDNQNEQKQINNNTQDIKEDSNNNLNNTNTQLSNNQLQKNEQIADSLNKIVAQKQNDLKETTNQDQQTQLQNEINELEDIALIKKQQAEQDLKQISTKEQANDTKIIQNNINENNQDNITKTEENEANKEVTKEEPVIKLTSSNAQALYEQSQKNEQIADSLNSIVAQKQKDLKKINNAKQRTKLQNEINELEDIALIKKQQAARDLKQAGELENNFVAENKQNNDTKTNQTNGNEDNLVEKDSAFALNTVNSKTDNYIVDNPAYSFSNNASQTESTNIEKYKKEIFRAQYYNNLAKESQKQLELLQSGIEKTTDDQTKIAIQSKIDELTKLVDDSKIKSEEYNKQADIHKTAALDEIPPKGISYADLLVEATNYKPELDPTLTKVQKDELISIHDDKLMANNILTEWSKIIDETSLLEGNLKNATSKNEKTKIEKQIEKNKKASQEKFKTLNDLYQTANEDEYKLYTTLLDSSRVISETDNSILANNLEKEAGLYYEKANIIRENSSANKETVNSEELIKAKNLELIAIQKQKHANDLYLKTKANPADTLNTSKAKISPNQITLLPEEQKMLKEYKRMDYNAEALKLQAENSLAEINQKREEANASYDKSKKEKILKGTQEKETKAKNDLLKAYQLYASADSVKFILYKNQLQQLNESIADVQNNKLISKQYIKEADFYYEEAKNIRTNAANIINIDEKIKEFDRAIKFEKMALNSQEIAVDALIEPEPIVFITDNTLVKVDRLEALNAPVNVDKVKKVDSYRIIEKLNLQTEEITSLDEGVTIGRDIATIELEAKNILKNIEDLTVEANNASSDGQRNKVEKKIKKLEGKLLSTQFSAAELQEVVNDSKYYIYKDHIVSKRLKGNAALTRQGQQLEGDATKNYNKAKSLRLQSSLTGDEKEAYNLLIEANNLELKGIENMEKAYSIYLGIQPVEEQLVAQNNNKEQGVKNEDILIKTKADITPIETKEEVKINVENQNDIVANNQVLELNDGSDQIIQKDTTQQNVENNLVENNNQNNIVITPLEDNNAQIIAKKDTAEQISNNNIDTINKNLVEENKQIIQQENNNQVVAKNDIIETNTKNNNVNIENNTDITNNNSNKEKETNNNPITQNTALDPTGLVINTEENVIDYSLKNAPAYTDAAPIPMNSTLPEGLVFKIQIGAFKNPIPQNSFRGLNPISGERLGNSQFTKYLVGLFRTVDASKLVLTEVKQMGYKDAFIVAYYNGKRISLYEARNLINAGSPDFVQKYNLVAQNEVNKLNSRTAEEKNIANNTIKNVAIDQANQNQAKADSLVGGAMVQATDVIGVEGLMYTVQIGVYKNLVTSQQLFNLSPIYKEQTPYGFVRYTCGVYSDINQAISEKDKIVKLGIPDAFVTAYYNGKRINPVEAKNIEQSKGAGVFAKTNNVVVPENQTTDSLKTTVTYTQADKESIVFKVQIGAYKEQVPTIMVDAFLKVASNHGLDQTKTNDGTTIYSVGKLKTYQEATTLKDTLINDGLKDAFVVAYKGDLKISVNEAKNILNQ